MQLQKQIIHTPPHFFNELDDGCAPDSGQTARYAVENRGSLADSILVKRADFHVRIADTKSKQHQVSALISKMYSWRGYRLDTPEAFLNPNQTTLQACNGKDTLGTLTLNVDSTNGLLADELYRKEIDALREHGRVVCELTGLAVSARFGSNELLASLFHLLHILGRRMYAATDAVIEINPRHSAYYQRLLGFRQIGERRLCGRVDAPAVLLHIETDFVEEQIARYADCRRRADRSLYPYFFSSEEAEQLNQRLLKLSPAFPIARRTHG